MFATLRLKHTIFAVIVFMSGIASGNPAPNSPPQSSETKTHGSQNFDEKSEKMRQRLEQLFAWRVSDRLQFTPDEEQKFNEQFKKLSAEKFKLAQDLDVIMDKIENEKGKDKEASKLLNAYQVNLKKTNDLQLKELQIMKKMFGSKRLVDYVLLKREMTQKFKDVLSQNSSLQAKGPGEKPNLEEPKVTQEK